MVKVVVLLPLQRADPTKPLRSKLGMAMTHPLSTAANLHVVTRHEHVRKYRPSLSLCSPLMRLRRP